MHLMGRAILPPFFFRLPTLLIRFKNPNPHLLALSRTLMASPWSCSTCTFLNSPSSNPTSCKVCLSPFASSSFSHSSLAATTNWSCRACTFSNKPSSLTCEICETSKEPDQMNQRTSSFSDFGLDEDEISDPSVGNVFLPLQPCTGRKRQAPSPSPEKPKDAEPGEVKGFSLRSCGNSSRSSSKRIDLDEDTTDPSNKQKIVVMSYNVWFREDLELSKRMEALGELIQLHRPDLMCFQEVTSNIYRLFENSPWWKEYKCSVPHQLADERPYFCMLMSKLPVKLFSSTPFSNSIMGRELCMAQNTLPEGKTLVLATTHLESPCPAPPSWNQMYSKERVVQAQQSINILEAFPNVIFAGDMNWDDKTDGHFPLTTSWTDAWAQLRTNEEGYTYDTKLNPMLTGNRSLRKRLDRFLVKFTDFEVTGIEMIGMDAIPGVKYFKDKKVRKEVKKLELPVLPSDHFGLLLTISGK